MGIKDLTAWLRKYKTPITLDDLTGMRFAVDTSTFLYRFVKGSTNWTDAFIELVKTLRSRRIKLIFVFDGKEVPPEKDAERQRRRDREAKTRDNYEWLKTVTSKTPGVMEEIKRRFPGRSKIPIPQNQLELREWLSRKKASMSISTRAIDDEIMAEAKLILDLLGIYWVEAIGESDPLCVELSCCGKVDGVLSADSDLLAYTGGADSNLIFVSDLDCLKATASFISKPQLLDECDLNEEEFRDFCILLGCDYNDKNRMYGYGPANAYRKMIQYRSIEALIEGEQIDQETIQVTNYDRCREMFTIGQCTVKVSPNVEPQAEALGQYLLSTKSRFTVKKILDEWTNTL
jgi:flap endonuclease-1